MADEFSHKRSKRYGKCANCDRYNTTKAWCQSCDPQKITQVWTSGNKDIDDCIKEFQLNAKKYKDVIEWIPFNRLDYVQMIGDGFSAIWLDGKRCVDGDGQNNEYTQSRMPSYKVELKTLTRSQNLLEMLREFIDDVQLNNRNFKVYGLTQNTATNEYMTVFDEFGSIRKSVNGKCANCNRHNTSYTWCRTCDPQKTIQGWTSGNNNVDDCIKEFQLKAIKYENVIEWIPFNRLDNIQMVGEGFSANWLDGIRIISSLYDDEGNVREYTQSRTPPHKVELRILHGFQNSLKEFKDLVRYNNGKLKVYGLTQHTTKNEYMLVFDEFGFERYWNNGKCTNCNRFNTSSAWCRTCDPQKTAQKWISRVKDIDDYIREFQLKATKYENVIEWIPFNRLDNFHKIGDKFSATWLDGKRCVDGDGLKKEYTQSRTSSYKVELKTLASSPNLLNILKEFKNHLQSESESVLGLTQNTNTNEYMLVFDFKRDDYYGKCSSCNRYNTSSAWCQSCDPQKTTEGWTSGNKDIDSCIKEFQLKATEYDKVIEWIPFNRLDNIQKIVDGFSATWLDGNRCVDGLKNEYTQSRTPSQKVELKILASSQNLSNILKEFKIYLQLESESVYGLTQNTTTHEYMLVFDEFGSKRNLGYGKCVNCNRYNTSYAWCQTCDPQKTIQELKSGNKDIDNCIKKLQLKTAEYEDVIEWIPFNRLDRIQMIDNRCLATWLDGIRYVNYNKEAEYSYRHTQARIPSYEVKLQTLTGSPNLFDMLNEFTDYVMLKNVKLKVYGLTQNITTNEYMLVFDEFGFKQDKENGKCTNCNRYNTSSAWCQACDPQKTTQGWMSGNKDIDDCIKEFQLKATNYKDVIEWIPFNKLENIQKLGNGFSATWLDGERYVGDVYNIRSRTSICNVMLKILHYSQNSLEFLDRFKDFMQSKDGIKVYGLTHDTEKNEYMLVFDEFYSRRDEGNGRCANCKRYNTSEAWCQICDPNKTTQGWTSGNKDVDDCIKEFQLKVTNYIDVIEWIPFNKLDNVQKSGDILLATWLDGIRYVNCNKEFKYGYRYTQSRIPSYEVRLQTLISSQNLLNIINEIKNHLQLEHERIVGLTQNATTNEYMLVLNEFGSKRNDRNGTCANCNRYNTSPAWCQTCDPQKTALGWTSGNKNIDDCIKELQLNATNYEDVIEWIPFNRLDNIQKVGEEFLAAWLDGVRLIQNIKEPTQSHNPSCRVKLKILHESKNLLELLRKFKEDLIQLKNNNSKVYGLTQNTSTDEYMLVFDFKREYIFYGKCANCNRYNTSEVWCQSCDPQKTTEGWTSGNKDVDDCIKEFQLKAASYIDVIEWIPFSRLNNFQKIGEGGFGTVFSATWLDGKRIASFESLEYVQSRTPSCIVALKTLPGSQENFLKEFKSFTEFRLMEVYGLTQNTTNNEYLMVFEYANKGSLHTFLSSNFRELNWKSKLKQLLGISYDLKKVHEAGYFHGDFHSGNILQKQFIKGNLISYVADLGLSRKKDESGLEDCIYGVLPYIAPEVLYKQPYTIAADIYSFGIIMTEISTGKPPHYGIEYDEELAIRICSGLRPEFAKNTPECYIKLAHKCMDANSSNRPSASYLYDELSKWYYLVNDGIAKDEDGLAILKAFQSADAVIPKLSTELSICPKDKLTSKMLNFKNLSKPVNSSLISLLASKSIEFSDIPTDY